MVAQLPDTRVISWLLDSDPTIRWQAMRDLLDLPERQWALERTKVETEGWGAQLLSHQDADGQWAGGAFIPRDFDRNEWHLVGQPWTATCWALQQLREFGLDPKSHRARETVRLIGVHALWDHDQQPYWDGEVEECINGRSVADGAYFGVDVEPIVKRLLSECQLEGGWNCERCNGSTRASFDTTINVLEGLLEFERAAGGLPDVRAARKGGEEFLLRRNLCQRLSTGEPADKNFLLFLSPPRWHYEVLRGLDYFRAVSPLTGEQPDPRLEEAISIVRSRQLIDGTWQLDRALKGRSWFDINDGVGKPSKWVTLRALRVLKWWDSSKG